VSFLVVHVVAFRWLLHAALFTACCVVLAFLPFSAPWLSFLGLPVLLLVSGSSSLLGFLVLGF
jgi:hypothetical protein